MEKSKALDFPMQEKGIIYQVSLLQGLTSGDYNGSVTLGELKRHGDTGIGTFDKLNGELIMLDGEIYRASGDGKIETVSDDETTPFAVVTFMNTDASKKLYDIPNYNTLQGELSRMVEENGINRFYMIRIDGLFREVNVRSIYPQEKPYKRLVKVLECDQTFFDYENIEGTMIGLYCPPYMTSLNAVGWHFHFISKDKTKGGHLLEANISDAMLIWSNCDAFELSLPQNEMFSSLDLTIDQSKDIEKIETNK